MTPSTDHSGTASRSLTPRQLRRMALAGGVSACMLLGACSSDNGTKNAVTGPSPTSASPTTSVTTAAPDTCAADALARVNERRAEPPMELPQSPSMMTKNKGKTIWLVTSSAAPIIHETGDAFIKAASAAGMTGKVWYSKGTADDAARGIAQAIGQRAGGIVLMGNPDVLKNQIKDVSDAGIPMAFFSQDASVQLPDSIKGSVPIDWNGDGRLAGSWIEADSGCNAEVGVIRVPVLTSSSSQAAGVKEELETNCPACKVYVVDVELAKLATDLPSAVSNLLQLHSGVNYIVAGYDSSVPPVQAVVAQVGAKVKVLGHDGNTTNADLIRQSKQSFDLALPPATWIAAKIVNEIGLVMAGDAPTKSPLPSRVVDDTNVGEAGTDLFPSYADALTRFQEVWGTK